MQLFKHLILAIMLLFIAGASHARDDIRKVDAVSQAELERILAPIALYPDTVLSHILVAATYPLEVVQAERWVMKHSNLRGSKAVEAVDNMDWDPSVKALVAFPQILKRLSQDLDWTQTLGEAFLQSEEQVLASIQSLRQLAADAGNLDDLEKVAVTRDENLIVIEPVEREVVYVPYYDTRTVYGPWRWSHYEPVYWDCPYHSHHSRYDHRRSFYWGPRVSVSYGFFFNTLHWNNRHIVRIPYEYYRPRQHYSHRDIIRHNRAQRWVHNPAHRRGVIYRNHANRDHYRDRHRDYERDRRRRNIRSELNHQFGEIVEQQRETLTRTENGKPRLSTATRNSPVTNRASNNGSFANRVDGSVADRANRNSARNPQAARPNRNTQRATVRDNVQQMTQQLDRSEPRARPTQQVKPRRQAPQAAKPPRQASPAPQPKPQPVKPRDNNKQSLESVFRSKQLDIGKRAGARKPN